MKDITQRLIALEEQLGVTFRNRQLLLSAVTHRSYRNEHPEATWDNYERLEFLGDAVLELCVREYLYRQFPDENEGQMTEWVSALTRGTTLTAIGYRIKLDETLLASKGLVHESRRAHEYAIACCVESVIGALYLDQGIGMCRMVVDYLLNSSFSQLTHNSRDPIMVLQELVQDESRVTPTYEIVQQGEDHEPVFTATVFVANRFLASAQGPSKKQARRAAAKAALESMTTTSRDV